jgi:hypothetical protein
MARRGGPRGPSPLRSTGLMLAVLTCFLSLIESKAPLQFNDNGFFKIAQFTDLHYGEGESEVRTTLEWHAHVCMAKLDFTLPSYCAGVRGHGNMVTTQ